MNSAPILAAVVAAFASALPTGAAEIPVRIVFRNDLPPVRVQDPDAGVYFIKIGIFSAGKADPNAALPDVPSLTELRSITFGRPIEGKDLPGRLTDISKKDLEARKVEDPNTLIKNDKAKLIFDGVFPDGAAWMKVRFDTAIWTKKAGARNWIAIALPILPEDRWVRVKVPADPCPRLAITIAAQVRGVHEDERDFTTTIETACE